MGQIHKDAGQNHAAINLKNTFAAHVVLEWQSWEEDGEEMEWSIPHLFCTLKEQKYC